jgi:hypothetical protein
MFGSRNVYKFQATDTYVIPIDPTTLANTNLIVAGATITGASSTDTATVVSYTKDRIYVTNPQHSSAFSWTVFTQGENLQIGGTTVAAALPNYVPGTTRAMGTYPFPGLRMQDGIFDGNKLNQTAAMRWEHITEIDWVASDSWVSDIWVKSAAGEGMLVGGRDGHIRNYKATDLQGNGLHFGDVDTVTGCWDWTVDGVDINGAAKDSSMGHNDGCVTYSNNTRNIRGSNAVFANAGGSGNTVAVAIGGINSYDNSETSWVNWKAYNCVGGPYSVNPPTTDPRDSAAKWAKLYDVHFAHYHAYNCGTLGQFGGNYSGDNAAQSIIEDCSLTDGYLYETVIAYGPFRRCKVSGHKHYSLLGFGSTPAAQIRGLIDSSTEIEVTDETTGSGSNGLIRYVGTLWDNCDLNNTARGGQYGIVWAQISSSATGTILFRSIRSRSNAIDNYQQGHLYTAGQNFASALYGDMDLDDSTTVTRWSPPPNYIGMQAFNPATKTSPGWLRFRMPRISLNRCAPAGGSGGIVNYTVSGAGVVTGATTNTNGSGYTAGTYYLCIPNTAGKPAVIKAVLSGTDLSTATYTVDDGGSGFSAGGTQAFSFSGTVPFQINTSQTNILVTEPMISTNGNRPPFSIGTTQTNVRIRGGDYDNAGWSVPNAGPRFKGGWTNGNRARASQAVGGSPVTFTNTLADDVIFIVSGGTVSDISFSATNGGTFDTLFADTSAPRTVFCPSNSQMKITYTVAPTVIREAV